MWKRIFILVFVLIILAGCGTQNNFVTPTLIPTSTSTQQILKSTATNLSTKTPTFNPIPTLSYETQRENLTNLFITNGGCDFPCWWGINIGDPIQKVSDLAPILGKSLHLYGKLTYSYSLSFGSYPTPDFYIEFPVDSNQNVQSMEILINQPVYFNDYHEAFEESVSLPSILTRYGKPNEILLLVIPRVEPTRDLRSYILYIVYEKQDFGVLYSGVINSEDPIQICSIKLIDYRFRYIQLFLQNPLSKISELNRLYSTKLYPINQVASVNLNDFYTLFSKVDNNYCIEITDDKWQ